MAAELIGYIYSIDRRVSYVKKNGETLILNSGSHITSHTDAEIIAAPVPINITYTTGDTELKCMYVPKSYLDKQTHVPASIFLKEAHNVRDLVTNTKSDLSDTKSDLANTKTDLANAKADSVSLQRQIVPSNAVESSATASKAYKAGDYVVVNGVLRKVTSSIVKGNSISDSNSTATTVTGEFGRDTGMVDLYNDPTRGTVSYRAKGGVCTLFVANLGGIMARSSWKVPMTIPRKFLPDGSNIYAALCHRQSDHQAQVRVPNKKDIEGNLFIYSAIDTTDNTDNRIHGIVSWVY